MIVLSEERLINIEIYIEPVVEIGGKVNESLKA